MRPRQSSFLEMPLIGTEVSPAHRPEQTSALPKPVASRWSILRRQASVRINLARASLFLLALASPAVADILDFETSPSALHVLGRRPEHRLLPRRGDIRPECHRDRRHSGSPAFRKNQEIITCPPSLISA